MAASMESSGQNRAATLMNAARRSHFVSRIEKYEAKVRQAKALIREKEASAMVEQKLPVPNIEGPPLAAAPKEQKESVANQRRAAFNFEEQQCFVPEKKILIPSEKVLPYFQASSGVEQNCTHQDMPSKQHGDYWLKNSHQYDNSLAWQLHERGYVSLEESRCEHPRGSSPDHRTPTEQKEIISGVLQRSSSSSMPSVVRSIDSLDMKSSIVAPYEKEFPGGFEPLEAHANIYYDFKPAPALEVNIAAIAGALKIRIKAADMCAPMQEHAFCSARECLNAVGKLQSKRVAYTLKKEFDKVYGPAWHCIVGTSFGSYVTHSLGGFVYFSLDKVSVLLFKTTVEPIENS